MFYDAGLHAEVTGTDVTIGAQPPAALEAGLALAYVRVHAAGDIRLGIVNSTAGAIEGADRAWTVALVGNENPV